MVRYVDIDLIDTQWNVNSFLANWQVSRQADLIDTQWNVNAGEVIGVYHDKDGFNRCIVECKCRKVNIRLNYTLDLIDTQWSVNEQLANAIKFLGYRFNRYIVECKYKNDGMFDGGAGGDLIDTQWNVNYLLIAVAIAAVIDLIDTQWNVNLSGWQVFIIFFGFNRYIVECKCGKALT